MQNFYGSSATTVNVAIAPQYGALSLAEELREQFVTDTLSATAVFCLPRDGVNTWRPSLIAHNPALHDEIDTPQKFRAHIIANASVPADLYMDYRRAAERQHLRARLQQMARLPQGQCHL
jgi:hypothetical protein